MSVVNCQIIKPLRSINFTPDVVFNYLCKLKRSFSTGSDGIPNVFLRDFANVMAIPLSSLFNVSFLSGALPDDWLYGCITPINKISKPRLVSDYRPITITSCIIKLMETIIRDAILHHCITNNILSPFQYGFLPKRSVETQLLSFMDYCSKSIDNRIPVDVFYLDFAKAFDTISHNILISKLSSIGIRDPLLSFIKAWLTNRTQSVSVNSCTSKPTRVTSGVPQGCVLSPLLFAIYINDLPSVIVNNCSILLFADDAKIFCPVRNSSDHDALINNINAISTWCNNNSMSLSISKCHILHIGSNNPLLSYSIGNHILAEPDFVRDLGVLVDKDLSFKTHIRSIVHQARVRLCTLNRAFKHKNFKIKLSLYRAFVRPILESCSSVWSPHYDVDSDLIESVQRNFTKYLPIDGFINLSYTDRLKFLGLASLKRRRIVHDLCLTYKYIQCNIHSCNRLFNFTNRASRNHSLTIARSCCKINARVNFFSVRVIEMWNALPPSIVYAKSIISFRRLLNTHLDSCKFY